MIAGVLCSRNGLGAILRRAIPTGTKCTSIAALHTTAPEKSTLGEFVQTMRFKYGNNIRHNLDNDKWAKLFVVEGNIKSGKGNFAKEFAEKLDLRYFPCVDPEFQITMMCYPEYREQALKLYRTVTQFSIEDFYANPENWPHIGRYQLEMISARFLQYVQAMCHLIWTGQGCVIERDFFALEVFDHALRKLNWVPEKVLEHYFVMQTQMKNNLLTPQCVIYLDVPPEQCYENLQSKGQDWEKKIPLDFLQAMDEGYNTRYLPVAPENGSKVIRLDWTKPEPVDDIIIDLDDMPSLQVRESRWDSHRATLMKKHDYFADVENLNSIVNGSITSVEELWYPTWVHWATRHFEETLPKRNEKFYWLKTSPTQKYSYKKRFGWLFTGLNLPMGRTVHDKL